MYRKLAIINLLCLSLFALGGCANRQNAAATTDTSQISVFDGEPDIQIRAIGAVFNWKFQYPGPDGKLGPLSPGSRNLHGDLAESIGLDMGDSDSQDDYISSSGLVLPSGKKVELLWTSLDVPHRAMSPGLGSGLDLNVQAGRESAFRLVPIQRASTGLPDHVLVEAGRSIVFFDEELSNRRIIFTEAPYQLICGVYCCECWYQHRSLIFVCSDEQFAQFLKWSQEQVEFLRDAGAN